MDHKTWLWRKKSTEKTIAATDKVDQSVKVNEEEILLTDKAELENDLKKLNEKLSSALYECNAKDDLVKKHEKMAQEALAGWEKVETEAVSLKQKLDEALQQRVAGEERLTHLDAALKECMQQLRFVREEQEQRIHDAVMKATVELEKTHMVLEEKLAEASKRLAKMGVENTHLSKALLMKEKLIEDLSRQKSQTEADLNALMTRLDSIEKDNASLKYEVRVLEKELEIRNEEREFNRRTADASHKQHLESVKKIAKLESECQRLRLLVRKRLPGPAALVKMKNEVEMLGRDSVETRRNRFGPSPTDLMGDFALDNSPDTPSRKITFLTEQLCAMEEENKTIREALNKKAVELQVSRAMYSRMASKLSQVESQLEELPKSQTTVEQTRSGLMSHEFSLASMSDVSSDDKVSCAESWASALILELEHFKKGKQRGSPSCKTVGASDINLMDDFVEMEKLAIVSIDKPSGTTQLSSDKANIKVAPIETESVGNSSEVTGREIVLVSDCQSSFELSNQEINSKDIITDKYPGWLQDIMKVVLKQKLFAQRNPDEIVEDIRVALAHINDPNAGEFVDARQISDNLDASNPTYAKGYISRKSTDESLVIDSSCGPTDVGVTLTGKNNQLLQSELGKSVCKIIELIEGITLPHPDYGTPGNLSEKDASFFSYKNSEVPSGYMVRVFQWKTSELSAVLQQFVHTCYGLLNGKSNINKFAQELTAALDWIINHCFSLQDVSSIRDAVKKHFDWDESRSEGEAEVGMHGQFSEADKFRLPREQSSFLTLAAASNGNGNFEKEELKASVEDENRKLKDELISMESEKKDLEEKLHSAIDKSKSLMDQHKDSEKTIASLQKELETLKESRGIIESQIENHKLVNEDLDTQFTVTKVELNEARQKLSSLEVELENKNNCCEDLETTCLELQLQLESVTKDNPDHEPVQGDKQLRTAWEITAASEKLAECQETILNLGKQLKALAPPREAALLDKVVSTPTDTNDTAITTATSHNPMPTKIKNMNQRSSLLDQMLAEDNTETKDIKSSKTKESDINSGSAFITNGDLEPLERIFFLNGIKHQGDDAIISSLAIVPSKKRGSGSLWKKLFWRKKAVNSKKTPLPFAP